MTTIVITENGVFADTRITTQKYVDGEIVSEIFTLSKKIRKTQKYIFTGCGSSALVNCFKNRFTKNAICLFGFSFNVLKDCRYSDMATVFIKDSNGSHIFDIKSIHLFLNFYIVIIKNEWVLRKNDICIMGSGSDYAKEFLKNNDDPIAAIKYAALKDKFTNFTVQRFFF